MIRQHLFELLILIWCEWNLFISSIYSLFIFIQPHDVYVWILKSMCRLNLFHFWNIYRFSVRSHFFSYVSFIHHLYFASIPMTETANDSFSSLLFSSLLSTDQVTLKSSQIILNGRSSGMFIWLCGHTKKRSRKTTTKKLKNKRKRRNLCYSTKKRYQTQRAHSTCWPWRYKRYDFSIRMSCICRTLHTSFEYCLRRSAETLRRREFTMEMGEKKATLIQIIEAMMKWWDNIIINPSKWYFCCSNSWTAEHR